MRNTILTPFRQRFLSMTATKQTRRSALLALTALLVILVIVSLPGFRQAIVSAAKKFTAPDAGTMCCGTWTQKATTGPSNRYRDAMAYAKSCNRVVLFGGLGNGANPAGALDDTWEWDGTTMTWTQYTPAVRPLPRGGHTMAYDSMRNRVVLFGGLTGNFSVFNDTWEYNCATHTWTQMNPANAPPGRFGHAMAYDPNLGVSVINGGQSTNQDTWTWNGTNWTQVAGGTQPGIRYDHAMAFDGLRVILFGGSKNAGRAANDTWGFTGAAWTQLTLTGPPSGDRLSMAQDPGAQRAILFGGSNAVSGSYNNESWEWNGANLTWCQSTLTAPLPAGREYPAMAYDGRGVIFHAGLNSGLATLADTWRYQGSRTYTFRAGLMDNFAPPSDPASPRPALVTQFGNPVRKDFDITTVDSWVLHSFTGLPSNIVAAELEVRMRPGNGDSSNDSINFAFPPNTSVTWGQRMTALPGPGTWDYPQAATTFILDLANLPPGAVGQPTNLLSLLNTHNLLDIAIQDDTTVDYIKLRVTACPPKRYFAGLPHEALGQAQLGENANGSLVVSNLGASGQDGVSISLGRTGSWASSFEDTGPMPNGTTIQESFTGVVNGVPEQPVATFTKVINNGMEEVTPDFSPLGTNTHSVLLYNAGTLVASAHGHQGVATIQTIQPHDTPTRSYHKDEHGIVWCQKASSVAFSIQIVGVGTFTGDNLIIISENQTAHVDDLSGARLNVFGIPSLAIATEAIRLNGHTVTALGAASLEPFTGGNLAVSNIGSSGAEGVRLNLGKALTADLSFDTMNPLNDLPHGANIRVTPTAFANNQSVSLGTLTVSQSRVPNFPWEPVTADFSAIGSSLQRVQIFNGNTSVADVSDFSGDVSASQSPNRISGLLSGFAAVFPPSTTFKLGMLMVQGDNIRITPLTSNVTPTYLTDLTVTAADMREFTLTNLALTSYCFAPLDIAPTSLPTGFVPATYPTTQLITTNGTPPYTYTATGLPPGLQLSASGTLTGTPTQAGTYSVAVTVTDSNGCTGQRNYNALVVTNCPVIDISPGSLPDARLNSSYSQVFTASGGVAPYTFKNAVGSSSPPGLTFNINGALSGMPANLGTFNFTVEVTDANGCKGTKSYTLNVICPPMTASISYATSLADTVDPNVAIGEVISYTLRVNLPEGLSAPITVTDIIPAGLGVLSINGKAAGSAIPLANIPNPVITPTSVACPNASGATITLNYGSINVPVNGNPNDNFFLIQIDAIVCDTPANSGTVGAQTVFNNSFSVGLTSNTQGQPPVCVVASNQVSATVVEPKLDVKKSFTPNLVQPGAVVPITITVTNTGNAPAYALSLQDVLSSCLTFLGATAPAGYTVANTAGTVTITGAANSALQVGAANALTFTINVVVGNCCVVSNTVTATAKTLPPNQAGSRTVTGSGSGSLIVNGGNCPCFTVPSSFNMDAWWSFDEMTGTVANDSAGLVNNAGNYGPGTAKPSPTPGVVSKALSFDGVDDYVEVAGSNAEVNFLGSCNTPGNKAFTIDSWVKFDAAAGVGITTILDKRVGGASPTGYVMYLFNGRPGFQIGDGTVFGNFIAPDSIADNNWHFLAVVMDRCNPTPPGQGRIYVDGALVYTFTISNLAAQINGSIVNNTNLQIGRSLINSSYTRFAIDELEFFKRALTATELNQIYQAGAGGKCKATPCATASFAQPFIRKAHTRPVSLVVTDFEPDGKPDLAVGNQTSFDVSILSGSNAYAPPVNYPLNANSNVNRLVAGSFNSNLDGRPDIAATIGVGGLADVVKTVSSPGYALTGINTQPNGQPIGIATGQFNIVGAGNDTFADLAVADYSANSVAILKGNGNGGFSAGQTILLPAGSGPTGIVVGRFNADAFDDLAVTGFNTNQVFILTGNGDGTFNSPTPFTSGNSGNKPYSLAVADINGSGGIDLVVVNQTGNNVTVFLGDGAGNFAPAGFGPFTVGSSPQAVAVGDLNCDGKTDLVVANLLSNFVSVLLGVGNGNFGAATNLIVGGGQTDVVLADLNGDNQLDIAVAIPNPGNVAILYNTCPCGGCRLPAIKVQPVSQKVCTNDTANFNAVAAGTAPMTIQWESSTDNGVTWTPISGATSNIYSTAETGKLFHAVFTNSCGTATSDAVLVTIDPSCVKICPDCNPPNTNNLRTGCCSTVNSSLIVQAPADVQWEFRSNRTWIIPTGRAGGLPNPVPPPQTPHLSPYGSIGGLGSSTITFQLPPNPLTTARTGTIFFAGSQYTVTQDGAVTNRTVRMVGPSGGVSPGSTFNVPIVVDALGNENSFNFSLSFDTNVLGNPQVALGSGAIGATFDSDSISVAGRLGVTVFLPTGQTLAVGAQQLAVVSFTVASNPGTTSTPLFFDDQPTPRLIQDVNFGVLPANFTDATIPIGCDLAITPSTLPNGMVNTAYNQTLTASGGTAPYSFSLNAGALPAGMTLSSTGSLSGTPTAAGTFNFTVKVTDANCMGTQTYSLMVNPASCTGVVITVNPTTVTNGFVGTAYNQTLTASGGSSPYTFTISAGASPAGLALSSAGVLSGTPTTAGTFPFTITATDTNGCSGSRQYTVIISGNGLVFYPLPRPVRIVDTRPGQGNCDNIGTPIAAGASLATLARLTCEGITIPATAQAVVGNLTVVNQTAQTGYLTIYPTGQAVPLSANMIYGPGAVLSNNFTVGLSSDGKFDVFGEKTIDVIVDISGYFAPPGAANPGGLYYHSLAKPVRIVDTRPGQGNCDSVATPIAAGTSLTTQARITCEGVTIPATAQAIVGNATVINGSGQTGYLTIYPNGVAAPLAANIIYFPGQVISNAFTVSLNASGEFNVFGERTIDMAIDVAGYYSSDAVDANGVGLLLTPLARPLRILDTRPFQGNCDVVGTPITGGNSIAAPGRLTCESLTIPATAQSILGNVTVVNQTASAGYLTLYPDGVTQPLVANMIYFPNQILSNAFVVGLNSGTGQFRIFAERTLDAIVDVSGYFAP